MVLGSARTKTKSYIVRYISGPWPLLLFHSLMSNSDLADQLSIKSLPIPTEQRLDVFVCDGVPDEALCRWESQGGKSTFHRAECSDQIQDWGKDMAQTCGIALFVAGSWGHLDERTSNLLQPFYDRAGSEANVFQWQPIEKNFVRRDKHWFDERKT